MLFAAAEPLEESEIARRMPDGLAAADVLARLKQDYSNRGVNLVCVGKKWAVSHRFDLGWLLALDSIEPKKLSKAALETLAIIAYHPAGHACGYRRHPWRRDLEGHARRAARNGGMGRLRGRRRTPGRPLTYGTNETFLLHFGLEQIGDLPGLDELKGAGMFDGALPQGFAVPQPRDDTALMEDEDRSTRCAGRVRRIERGSCGGRRTGRV